MFQGSFSFAIYNNLAFSFLWPINKAATRMATTSITVIYKNKVELWIMASDYPEVLLPSAGL